MVIVKKQIQKTRQLERALPLVSVIDVESKASQKGLKKPVHTLAMVPLEGGRISLVERKLYFTLMYFAQREGWREGQEKFRTPLVQVLKKMDFQSHNISGIRKALVSMVTTAIEWQSPTLKEGSAGWGVTGLMAHAEIIPSRDGNIIEWSYSVKMRSNILDPSVFVPGTLEIQNIFRSYAAASLFDICSRYLGTGLTPRRPWLWWRPVVTGGSDGLDTEPQFKTFSRDVLKKALMEINLNTHIDVQLILYKVGQRVTDIQFKATKKKNYTPPLQNVKTESGLKEIGRVIAAGISQKQAELFFEEHGETTLSKSMDIFEGRQERKNLEPIKEPKSYLKRVLENQPIDALTGALVDIKKEESIEKQKKVQLLEMFRTNKLTESWELFNESNDEDKAALTEQFEHQVINSQQASVRKMYDEKGVQTNAIRALMKNFLVANFFGEFWSKPTEEEMYKFAVLHAKI